MCSYQMIALAARQTGERTPYVADGTASCRVYMPLLRAPALKFQRAQKKSFQADPARSTNRGHGSSRLRSVIPAGRGTSAGVQFRSAGCIPSAPLQILFRDSVSMREAHAVLYRFDLSVTCHSTLL
jgi:hypothetical protein